MKQIPGQLYVLKPSNGGDVCIGMPKDSRSASIGWAFVAAGTVVLLIRSDKNERLCLVGENLFWFEHRVLGPLEP